MEILEAFDLTGSHRAAAELAGCDHETVARYVRERDRGQSAGAVATRRKRIDPHLAKLEEWVERSHGKVRADIVHAKLRALGFTGSQDAPATPRAAGRRAAPPAPAALALHWSRKLGLLGTARHLSTSSVAGGVPCSARYPNGSQPPVVSMKTCSGGGSPTA